MRHPERSLPADEVPSLGVIKEACRQALAHDTSDHARHLARFHALADPAMVHTLIEMIEHAPAPPELQAMKELLRDLAACVEKSVDYNARAAYLNPRYLVTRAKMMLNLIVL